ncbi:phosphonate C-P lyase system protein PhnH [Microvirga sp. VF16]|uniref:phosphonate C-P lyase system protein PhnH n=1 Tax=Microvirga sp. VF16 TaxID=2807101 RepID=UPI00193E14C7|nr:phosphonate C-P lyase system protein PhnH [Microvirga sp. VF16]QRM32359.1 phosphonate C-P lyase system protein PhnH [Microvirga sp. VF16]
MNSEVISAPFRNPIHEAQQAFRALLSATSRPGTIVELPVPPASPQPLGPTLSAIALTLLDDTTPVWLDATLATEAVLRYLRFHTGARVVSDPKQAAFGIIGSPQNLTDFRLFSYGDAAYPDRSATLVLQVPSLTGGSTVSLAGPGIETSISVTPAGLPSWFWHRWNENAASYPIGVDVILADDRSVIGLPRTIKATFS